MIEIEQNKQIFFIYCLFYEVILLNSRPLCVGTYYYLYRLRWDDQCGEVPVDEREERVQKSRHILSSGLAVDYATEDDYIYGSIPEP